MNSKPNWNYISLNKIKLLN